MSLFWLSWPVRVALIIMAGIVAGSWLPQANIAMAMAALSIVMMGVMTWLRKPRGVCTWSLIGLLAASSAWYILREHHTVPHDLSRYVMPAQADHPQTFGQTFDQTITQTFDNDQSRLVRVTGIVASSVNLTQPHIGPFEKFSYQNAATFFTLKTELIDIGNGPKPVQGNALVRINRADHLLQSGMRIVATGWLTATRAPYNPGDHDYRRTMRKRGIAAHLTLPTAGNWHEIGRHPQHRWHTWRQSMADRALDALRIGIRYDPHRLAFLETILLGRRSGALGELQDDFKRTGLAHLLSISGAHLGILMGLAWVVCRLFVHYPPRAALIVLALLILYLLIVPARVPVVRAGIMGGLFCIAGMTGRRIQPVDILATACIIVLIWRPADLFAAGFQLSFGVVTALITWTNDLTQRLIPSAFDAPEHPTTSMWLWKRAASYVAVGIVAFTVAAPLVAYHFEIITPLSIVLSLIALPVVTATLGLGYLKILIGILWPSLSLLLAGPLGWTADTTTSLVHSASDWPGSTIVLANAPSAAWTWTALAVVAAWLSGLFYRRHVALTASAIIILGWLTVSTSPNDNPYTHNYAYAWLLGKTQPAMQITMIAVGDGSCYLLRTADDDDQPGKTILFDCGSYQLLNIGTDSIIPTLRKMGIDRIDLMILSHADLDHYGASLDILAQIPVDQIVMPAAMLAESRARPNSATRVLIDALQQHGTPIEIAQAGWSQKWGAADATIVWPPPNWQSRRANDTSLVLSVRTANRRLLLNGDIEQRATNALLAQVADNELDLHADITDLPHHGAFIPSSPAWLNAVDPQICLQSNAAWRLTPDPWKSLMKSHKIQRFSTARHGMVDIRVMPDGQITTSTFRHE